jgi:hypothetical protein
MPAFGSYAGPLPRIVLGERGLGVAAQLARRKRWVWFGVTGNEVVVSAAVVRTGYAATVFLLAYDLRARKMLVDANLLGPAFAARVADDPRTEGALARFSFGRSSVVVTRDREELAITAALRGVAIDVVLDFAKAPPPIAAIADLGPGLVDATEKRALAAVRGTARFAGRSFAMDGAFGGYDYTNGLLPRHTKWRWAFAMGRAADGEPVAFNFCEGFVGEAECAAFVGGAGGAVLPLPEPRFEGATDAPERPWRLVADGVDLAFSPGAVHTQTTNLVLVRSRFLQPVGIFSGRVRAGAGVGDRELVVLGLPGVVEDQDVLW